MNQDRQLIDRLARHGDVTAFDSLYAANADPLYRFVLRLTNGDRDLADDVFQETWVVAIGKLAEFERRSSFYTWLAGIAFNKARRHRDTSPPLELIDDPVDSGTEERLESRIDVEALLRRLPEGYQAVLVLHAEGFTHAEIGGLLGISDGTSKSQLSRARRAAWRLVGDSDER